MKISFEGNTPKIGIQWSILGSYGRFKYSVSMREKKEHSLDNSVDECNCGWVRFTKKKRNAYWALCSYLFPPRYTASVFWVFQYYASILFPGDPFMVDQNTTCAHVELCSGSLWTFCPQASWNFLSFISGVSCVRETKLLWSSLDFCTSPLSYSYHLPCLGQFWGHLVLNHISCFLIEGNATQIPWLHKLHHTPAVATESLAGCHSIISILWICLAALTGQPVSPSCLAPDSSLVFWRWMSLGSARSTSVYSLYGKSQTIHERPD